jgi:simple sugar transport system ATP-binding protein
MTAGTPPLHPSPPAHPLPARLGQPPPAPQVQPPLVQLRGITKTFPGVLACCAVDLDVARGEIHALLGENGAGKSTLMNILTGIYHPDAGEILIDGERRHFSAPKDAMAAGIGMVHQHFKLVTSFTVAENLHLGWERTPARIRARDLAARTREVAHSMGLAVQPDARIDELSTGEQQRVEILRVLARRARVLILDEPTAVLSPSDAQELFKTLKAFVAHGNAVILISHKLDEVLKVADRISVLRGGRRVATEKALDSTASGLARLMVGHDLVDGTHLRGAARVNGSGPAAPAVPVLELRDIAVIDSTGRTRLDRVSLKLYGGEILGIAGVTGNGQKELSQVVSGMLPVSAGSVMLGGEDFSRRSARDFTAFGLGHIPEDRLQSGLAATLSVIDNCALREYDRPPISRKGWYRPARARALAQSIAAAAAVRVADFAMPAANLSGGNQQRIVARREMRIATRVLVAAYPSRGLDVGAIETMMRYFVQLRDEGVGVILISEELDELRNVADRIAVMCQGAIMGVLDPATASIEDFGLALAGQRHGVTAPREPRATQKLRD